MKREDKLVLLGTAATIGGLALILPRIAKAVELATYEVSLKAEPEDVEIKVDDLKVNTPKKISLTEGVHSFEAPKISLNLLTHYEFYAWIVNGKITSYSRQISLNIEKTTTMKALYRFTGRYPEFIVLI